MSVRLPAKRKPMRIEKMPQRIFPKHRAFVRKHFCCVPGCNEGPIEFAHVRSAANSGMGLKPADWFGIALHREHHAEQHSIGQPAFERKYALDLMALAKEFARVSPDIEMKIAMREAEQSCPPQMRDTKP